MRRFLADFGAVVRDMTWVFVVTVLALAVVLVGGLVAHVAAGPAASMLVVNEGLVLVVLALIGWLVLFGRHRYERRHR